MSEDVIKRCVLEAEYIILTGATVRQTAKVYMMSKSTIHKDITERLYRIDKNLCKEVKKVLNKNLSERHIRGGEATKQKYLQLKK